jgi:hypothetical protein
MSRQANGRIRIGNQGACSLTARFRPQCPRTVRQNPKNRKSSLRPSSESDWMVVF